MRNSSFLILRLRKFFDFSLFGFVCLVGCLCAKNAVSAPVLRVVPRLVPGLVEKVVPLWKNEKVFFFHLRLVVA